MEPEGGARLLSILLTARRLLAGPSQRRSDAAPAPELETRPMAEQRYAATLVTERGRVFVPVPFNPDANWGFEVEHHVRGTINEMDVRGVLEPLDDGRGLVLGPVWRRDRHLESGAAVEVMLEPEGHSATTLPTTSRRRWLGIRLQEHSSTRSRSSTVVRIFATSTPSSGGQMSALRASRK